MNLLKKGSFLRKCYFNFDLDNFESSSENLLKVIICYKKYFQNLK